MGWDDVQIKNAKITQTFLGLEDHGIFTATITLDYGGSGQSFGGYSFSGEEIPAKSDYCGYFVRRVMEIVGVNSWEELKGEKIRVKASHSKVEAIGNLLEGNWFNPGQEFKEKFPKD